MLINLLNNSGGEENSLIGTDCLAPDLRGLPRHTRHCTTDTLGRCAGVEKRGDGKLKKGETRGKMESAGPSITGKFRNQGGGQGARRREWDKEGRGKD